MTKHRSFVVDKYHLPFMVGRVNFRANELCYALTVSCGLGPLFGYLHLLFAFLEFP